MKLVYDLDSERRKDGTQRRPIIFIAHDVGGIVVKWALLYSDLAREGGFKEQRSVKLSTYGIIFMGTPHQGSQGLLNIAKMQDQTSDNLLKHLEEHSGLLQKQTSEFVSISRDFEIKFAYETLPTPVSAGNAVEVS